jgi:hypothetical protein
LTKGSRIGGALLFALAAYVVIAAAWSLWRPSGALTPATAVHGWTQGTRPCSSSAMILSVISW